MRGETFIDDSGGLDQPFVLLGGWLATATAWDDFYDEWDEVLAIPPAVPYWHMSSARSKPPKPPFDRLTPDQRHARELLLADVIKKHAIRGIAVHLRTDHYKQIVHNKIDLAGTPLSTIGDPIRRRAAREINSPYPILVSNLYAILREQALAIGGGGGPYVDKVRIVVEKDKGSEQQELQEDYFGSFIRAQVLAAGEAIIDGLAFEKGKCPEWRPLEAADMLAWNVNQALKYPDDEHELWLRLKAGPPILSREIDAGRLRAWVAFFMDPKNYGPRWREPPS